MTVVLLIRHAVTEATAGRLTGTAEGFPLSKEGREQAGRLADRLAPLPLAAVYTSPLERCVETAAALAARRGLDPRAVDGLREIEYGRWTGRSYRQIRRTALWDRVQRTPSTVRFPGGERLVDAQQRGVEALEALAASHRGRALAAVTHADIIRLALAHYAGVHVDLFQRLVVSPASITALQLDDGPPAILRVNDTGSLDDLLPPRRSTRRARRPLSGGRPVG